VLVSCTEVAGPTPTCNPDELVLNAVRAFAATEYVTSKRLVCGNVTETASWGSAVALRPAAVQAALAMLCHTPISR